MKFTVNIIDNKINSSKYIIIIFINKEKSTYTTKTKKNLWEKLKQQLTYKSENSNNKMNVCGDNENKIRKNII